MKITKFSKAMGGFRIFQYPLDLSIRRNVFTSKWQISITNYKTGKNFHRNLI